MKDNIPVEMKDRINVLKNKYPTIYGLKIGECYFILRPLSRREFSIISELQNYVVGAEDDFIFKTCVLYPQLKAEDLDQMLAGTVSEITRTVIDLSGFSSADTLSELMKVNRDMMDLADNQITAILCKAFPQLTPEIIDEFDIYKITHYLALAEQMLGVTLDIPKDKNTQESKTNSGPIDFSMDNNELFKSEVGGFMPKEDHNVDRLKGGNVG